MMKEAVVSEKRKAKRGFDHRYYDHTEVPELGVYDAAWLRHKCDDQECGI